MIEVPKLRHVTDAELGLGRRKTGRGFRYVDRDGAPIRDTATLARIRALAIPPAWTDVWICESANGYIQAIGRDARGRKQYRYHADWRAFRDAVKFDRLADFGAVLPQIRRRVSQDLNLPRLERDKVLAVVVRLLETTLIRIGNEEYARKNASYGLTTLRNSHVKDSGSEIRLVFKGKGGKQHEVSLDDPRIARIVRTCVAIFPDSISSSIATTTESSKSCNPVTSTTICARSAARMSLRRTFGPGRPRVSLLRSSRLIRPPPTRLRRTTEWWRWPKR